MRVSSVVDDARARVLSLVQLHGWNATAFQTLEAPYSYFFAPDACVAYVDTGKAWVAAGAPIAAPEQIAPVAAAFVAAAHAAGKRVCFSATEERMRAMTASSLQSLRIGEQPVWNPKEWPGIVKTHRSLREQLRRARAKGVTVRLLSSEELASREGHRAITRIADEWLARRVMAPMGFLVHLDPFSFPAYRRCFVAELAGEMIAFAGVIPVPSRAGWFIEDVVRTRSAPNGTAELLTDAVMTWTAEQGSDWLTLGLAPLAGDVTGLLRIARSGSTPLYDFEGLRRYKEKLRPASWSPIYVLYPKAQTSWLTIVDMLTAFSRGGLLRFGLQTLRRGPRAVLQLLALLLVPWTVVLATPIAAPWFPNAGIRWGWVAFDAIVAISLIRLLQRPSRRLATALVVATAIDTVLTVLESLVWNVPRARTLTDYAIIVLACLAPLVATAMLWGARQTRLRD